MLRYFYCIFTLTITFLLCYKQNKSTLFRGLWGLQCSIDPQLPFYMSLACLLFCKKLMCPYFFCIILWVNTYSPLCNKSIHTGYNNLNKTTYIQTQHSDINWFGMPCLNFPLIPLLTMNWKKYTMVNTYSSSHLKTQSFTKNANNFLQDKTNNKIQCLYFDIADFNKIVATHIDSFSLLHLNIFS